MNGVFSVAAGCFAGLVFALVEVVHALRWHERKRLWWSVAASSALAVVGISALWLGIQYPTANFWGGQDFGSAWECEILGKGGAKVCLPDVPQPAKNPPPAGPR
jgi:xanthosine utilization system XapX-like protein